VLEVAEIKEKKPNARRGKGKARLRHFCINNGEHLDGGRREKNNCNFEDETVG